ncbi:phytoene/squalene synthase family protein [Lutibaculum baratangense]|uniref:Phytoene synthase n=1 Tax=Lutibaculum baratangense AMV1 TaxID=631454 RepID=V4QUY2_9HYPH|nr:phytoene/squalene synthase family protein [Lutibaculum baratangense]ESR23557.1 Phytoene synthase [Lutibaculum baratangense AMV1]
MADAAIAHVSELLRQGDKDRFLCDLFVPAEKRPHIMALHAFALEIARVREVVSEPMPGEIRLQWWRDAIEGHGHGNVAQHPVGGLLLEALDRFDLPRQPLLDLIEARSFDLYDDPMGSVAELEGYGAATVGPTLALPALALDRGIAGADLDPVSQSGGIAYATAGLLRAIPLHASRGQVYMPLDVLERHGTDPALLLAGKTDERLRAALKEMATLARSHLSLALDAARRLPAGVVPALLPLALVTPYLDRFERAGCDPFSPKVDLPQWRRQWTLWRSARRGFA